MPKPNIKPEIIDGTKTPRPDIINMDEFCEDVKNEISLLANIKCIIKDKKRQLNQSKSILELKYNKYKKCHNFWSIGTIILSSALTLIESSKLIFIDNIDEKTTVNDFFVFSPIVLGTIITCTTSLVKFKKYQEQMEEIYIVIDRCICMTARLKSKKDEINILIETEKKFKINKNSPRPICNDKTEICKDIQTFKDKVKAICDSFNNDIVQEFSGVFIETERYIDYLDYHKYLKIINAVEYRRHILREDKLHFYDKYDHDIDTDRMEDIKKDALRGCNRVSKKCCCC